MVGFGQAMFDATAKPDPVEGMAAPPGGYAVAVLGQVGELNAAVGERGMDAIGNGSNQRFEEGGGSNSILPASPTIWLSAIPVSLSTIRSSARICAAPGWALQELRPR